MPPPAPTAVKPESNNPKPKSKPKQKRMTAKRQALIDNNLDLVRWIARKQAKGYATLLWRGVISFEDLEAWAFLGLRDAALTFNFEQGVKFSTYAPHRMVGAVLDGLRQIDHVPRLARGRISKIEQAKNRIKASGEAVTAGKIVAETGYSAEKIRTEELEFRALGNPHSGDSLCGGAATESGGDFRMGTVWDLTAGTRQLTRRQIDPDLLKVLCCGLTKTERIALILYFVEGVTMKEIGEKHVGLSESRISQMLKDVRHRIITNTKTCEAAAEYFAA